MAMGNPAGPDLEVTLDGYVSFGYIGRVGRLLELQLGHTQPRQLGWATRQ